MRRRDFITLVGGGAAAWPLAARAQQPALPVIGFFHIGSPQPRQNMVAAFRVGLRETGYVEGQNVLIEYRWAEGQYSRLPTMAADLVRRQVAVIVTPAATGAAIASKAATSTIPIVFAVADDPVKYGLVASFARPGGNATGVSYLSAELGPKRLGLLHDLLPNANLIGILTNPNSPTAEFALGQLKAAAQVVGQQLEIVYAGTNDEIDSAFGILAQKKVNALLVHPDPLFTSRLVQIVTLATLNKIPAIYQSREWTEAGGLMSYGTSISDVYRQVGIYAGRILKGEKAADLPVVQPTKIEFLINLQTAKTLGLTVSNQMQLLADEIVE
jgi:putative ABC transport system substrate-binding protein